MLSGYNMQQLQMLIHFFLLGLCITFVYDILRVLRKIIPHNNAFIAAEDLVFWLLTGFIVFWLFQEESNGTIRFFSIGGGILGMIFKNKLTGNIKMIKMKLCKRKKRGDRI